LADFRDNIASSAADANNPNFYFFNFFFFGKFFFFDFFLGDFSRFFIHYLSIKSSAAKINSQKIFFKRKRSNKLLLLPVCLINKYYLFQPFY